MLLGECWVVIVSAIAIGRQDHGRSRQPAWCGKRWHGGWRSVRMARI